MKIFNFLPLNSDHRGATYENDYLSVEENADVRGCVFFDCTFDSQASYSRALNGGGICIGCVYSVTERSKVVYVNAESIITLEVYDLDDCGILGGGKYIIFSDSDFTLSKYNLESKIEWGLREKTEGLQKKTLDSNTFARVDIQDGINIPSDIADNTYEKDFGFLRKWYFDASERLYARDGGDNYSAFIYVPPQDHSNLYIFGEDVSLLEVECSGGDIAEVVKELFPDKTSLSDTLYEDDEINTFRDAIWVLDEYLSRSEITSVRNNLFLRFGDAERPNYFESTAYLESMLFRTILTKTSSSFSTLHGQKVGLLLDKSLLILDYDKVVPPPRYSRKVKFVIA